MLKLISLLFVTIALFLNNKVVAGQKPPCDSYICHTEDPNHWGLLYAHLAVPSKFYECTPFGLEIFDCPAGLVFPICGERCEFPDTTGTSAPTTTTTTTTTTTQAPTTQEQTTPTVEEISTTPEPTTQPHTIVTTEKSTTEPEPGHSTTESFCWENLILQSHAVNWASALNACKAMSKNLVVVDSQSKYDCLLEFIQVMGLPDATNYWTGGNDIVVEGNFVWDSTQAPVQMFYPVGNGQPDNGGPGGNEDCVSLRKVFGEGSNEYHVMNDEICGLLFASICE